MRADGTESAAHVESRRSDLAKSRTAALRIALPGFPGTPYVRRTTDGSSVRASDPKMPLTRPTSYWLKILGSPEWGDDPWALHTNGCDPGPDASNTHAHGVVAAELVIFIARSENKTPSLAHIRPYIKLAPPDRTELITELFGPAARDIEPAVFSRNGLDWLWRHIGKVAISAPMWIQFDLKEPLAGGTPPRCVLQRIDGAWKIPIVPVSAGGHVIVTIHAGTPTAADFTISIAKRADAALTAHRAALRRARIGKAEADAAKEAESSRKRVRGAGAGAGGGGGEGDAESVASASDAPASKQLVRSGGAGGARADAGASSRARGVRDQELAAAAAVAGAAAARETTTKTSAAAEASAAAARDAAAAAAAAASTSESVTATCAAAAQSAAKAVGIAQQTATHALEGVVADLRERNASLLSRCEQQEQQLASLRTALSQSERGEAASKAEAAGHKASLRSLVPMLKAQMLMVRQLQQQVRDQSRDAAVEREAIAMRGTEASLMTQQNTIAGLIHITGKTAPTSAMPAPSRPVLTSAMASLHPTAAPLSAQVPSSVSVTVPPSTHLAPQPPTSDPVIQAGAPVAATCAPTSDSSDAVFGTLDAIMERLGSD